MLTRLITTTIGLSVLWVAACLGTLALDITGQTAHERAVRRKAYALACVIGAVACWLMYRGIVG